MRRLDMIAGNQFSHKCPDLCFAQKKKSKEKNIIYYRLNGMILKVVEESYTDKKERKKEIFK